MGDKTKVTEMNNYVNNGLIYYREKFEELMDDFLDENKKAVIAKLRSKKDSLGENLDYNIEKME